MKIVWIFFCVNPQGMISQRALHTKMFNEFGYTFNYISMLFLVVISLLTSPLEHIVISLSDTKICLVEID
jgi:hypothetical protein